MVALPPVPEDSPRANQAPFLATRELLRLAKLGDSQARDQLATRYLPRLTRWAAGRLPLRARSLLDTSDLVQDALSKVLEGLEQIEVRGPGGFQAYVRQVILNRIRDELRSVARRPGDDGSLEALHDSSPSPLENAIGADVLARYERGLAALSDEERELLHLRIELDFGYEEIAAMTDRPTSNAARMAIQRALGRLAKAMGRDDRPRRRRP
jgi:RNA polymerase sigma-70 factor (ECF subfamily)